MYEITASVTNDEDFELVFVIVDEDDTERDITDFDFDFTLNDSDGNVLLDQDSTDVTVTKNVAESTVTIVVLADAFADYVCGPYKIGCRYTDTVTGRTKQLFKGTLKIEEGGF